MTAQFNFERAWRELAGPAFENLSDRVKDLYTYIATHGREWKQNSSLDVPFPSRSEAPLPGFRWRFDLISDRELAVAAHTIFNWGHWAYVHGIRLEYCGRQQLIDPEMREAEFTAAQYGSYKKAKKAAAAFLAEASASYPKDEWKQTFLRYGPSYADAGASWKFANFVDQVLRSRLGLSKDASSHGISWRVNEGILNCHQGQGSRGWTNNHVGWATREMLAKARAFIAASTLPQGFADELRDHLMEDDPDKAWLYKEFMDHEEGTEYADAELPALFQPLVDGVFRAMNVQHVNYKPHPFVVTAKHLEASEGPYLDPSAAMCGYREGREACRLPYEKHTSDRVLFLQFTRNVPQDEAQDTVVKIKNLLAEHKIDGVAFVEHPEGFQMIPKEEAAPAEGAE